jgi:hypothetical protein
MNNNIPNKQLSSSSSSSLGETSSSENIFYYVNDNNENNNNDSSSFCSSFCSSSSSCSTINNEEKITTLYNEYGINPNNSFDYYMTNYTVKQLTHIMNYYKINIHKLRKNEMAQLIVLFENEYNNIYKVNQREKLWNYISEIKNDEYLSKFLLFDI